MKNQYRFKIFTELSIFFNIIFNALAPFDTYFLVEGLFSE